MKRAYSLFEIKGYDDDARELTGMATTPEPDRAGDIVDPKGAEFKLPIPLLWQHDGNAPIGEVTHARVTAKGIEVRAKLAKTDTPGELKDRLDTAWESLKIGLVKGFSIGFRGIKADPIDADSWSLHFKVWEWLELSAVTIPANSGATIQTVKSMAQAERVALDQRNGVVRFDRIHGRVRSKSGVIYSR